jgi:hypothetical protein
MKKKPQNWEDGDTYGADILGFGQFQFIHGGSGKSKAKDQIGFVRQKGKKAQKVTARKKGK